MADPKSKPAAGAPPVGKEPVAKYKVISPLCHDGVDYAVGDTVELTESQAAALLGQAVK